MGHKKRKKTKWNSNKGKHNQMTQQNLMDSLIWDGTSNCWIAPAVTEIAGASKVNNTVVTYKSKTCRHDGKIPVNIGGFDVRLTSSNHADLDMILTMDYLCSLNGYLPKGIPFGTTLPFVVCDLPDRGGVPKEWPEFIKEVATAIQMGKKVAGWCTGSHGRTGVFGASLIAVLEPDTEDPIAEIRKRHCNEAVESKAQATAIFALKGLQLPKIYIDEFTSLKSSRPSFGGGVPYTIGQRNIHHKECTCVNCVKEEHKFQWQPGICQCPFLTCVGDRAKAATAVKDSISEEKIQPPVDPWPDTNVHLAWCCCKVCVDMCMCNPQHDPDNKSCSCAKCTQEWKWDLYETEYYNGHSKACSCTLCITQHILHDDLEDDEEDSAQGATPDHPTKPVPVNSDPGDGLLAPDEHDAMMAEAAGQGSSHDSHCDCQKCWHVGDGYGSDDDLTRKGLLGRIERFFHN